MKWVLGILIRRLFPGWLLLTSCSAAQHAPPECNGMRREELTAILVAEVTACADQACIERAEARHNTRRQKWVECGGDK